ncbi:MAG: DUF4258 domain-containing protein [Planctomycetes bacterium]|nr:DUF4258 domain-containing protein [Planctomycetota bacterium]
MISQRWPEWWDWELELSLHLFKRMTDRGFSELDLRGMLERARGYRSDIIEGRWVIITAFRGRTWEVVVEPDADAKRLVVITAYPYEEF